MRTMVRQGCLAISSQVRCGGRTNARCMALHIRHTSTNAQTKHRSFVALGSNLGDRIGNIEEACRRMDKRDIRVLRTSSLWQTKPMYVLDQPEFVNGVCEVETALEPLGLLDAVQSIENEMGRKKTVDKGPRNIDLDILRHDSQPYKDSRLQVPHADMLSREFVLRPLCQLIPNQIHLDTIAKPYFDCLSDLALQNESGDTVTTLVPLNAVETLTPLVPTRKTRIMGILNITPDSFSDGGTHDSSDLPAILKTAQEFVASGAAILDVGGQSSRPSAVSISPKEETARVVPVIEHLRSNGITLPISIDTYRASVASAAIAAGADLINDISGGLLDPAMFSTAATLNVPIIISHLRGTPETMTSFNHYPSSAAGVISTIARELHTRVLAAEAAGIRKWRIILDPGIGFAKGKRENLILLRDIAKLKEREEFTGIPWLVGASRKGFLGHVSGRKLAHERTWATAATVSACIQGGVDMVRVHDVAEMADVVKVSDAIWRSTLDR